MADGARLAEAVTDSARSGAVGWSPPAPIESGDQVRDFGDQAPRALRSDGASLEP